MSTPTEAVAGLKALYLKDDTLFCPCDRPEKFVLLCVPTSTPGTDTRAVRLFCGSGRYEFWRGEAKSTIFKSRVRVGEVDAAFLPAVERFLQEDLN